MNYSRLNFSHSKRNFPIERKIFASSRDSILGTCVPCEDGRKRLDLSWIFLVILRFLYSEMRRDWREYLPNPCCGQAHNSPSTLLRLIRTSVWKSFHENLLALKVFQFERSRFSRFQWLSLSRFSVHKYNKQRIFKR